jgi:hypothetical protein
VVTDHADLDDDDFQSAIAERCAGTEAIPLEWIESA